MLKYIPLSIDHLKKPLNLQSRQLSRHNLNSYQQSWYYGFISVDKIQDQMNLEIICHLITYSLSKLSTKFEVKVQLIWVLHFTGKSFKIFVMENIFKRVLKILVYAWRNLTRLTKKDQYLSGLLEQLDFLMGSVWSFAKRLERLSEETKILNSICQSKYREKLKDKGYTNRYIKAILE